MPVLATIERGGLGHLSVDRATAFAYAGITCVLNGMAGKIVLPREGEMVDALISLGGLSAIIWFALYSLLAIAQDEEGFTTPLNKRDRFAVAAMFGSAFIPINYAGAIGLLSGALYLLLTSSAATPYRRLAVVMLALTGPLIWGRLLLAFTGSTLLKLDAQVAGLIADLPVEGNVVSFSGNAGKLYIALPCSSVHNMSLAIILFTSLTQLMRLRLTPALLAYCAMAAMAIAAINMTRLAALARFPEYYLYLHTGQGAQIFGFVAFAAAGAMIGLGIVKATPDS